MLLRSIAIASALQVLACASDAPTQGKATPVISLFYRGETEDDVRSTIVADVQPVGAGLVRCLGDDSPNAYVENGVPMTSNVVRPAEWERILPMLLTLRAEALASGDRVINDATPHRFLFVAGREGPRVGCLGAKNAMECGPDFSAAWDLVLSLENRCE